MALCEMAMGEYQACAIAGPMDGSYVHAIAIEQLIVESVIMHVIVKVLCWINWEDDLTNFSLISYEEEWEFLHIIDLICWACNKK